MSPAVPAPSTELDIFDVSFASDPERLTELRDLGPAVWVARHGFWVLTRYDAVRAAAVDWETYSSAAGVALLDDANDAILGAIIATDPPQHDVIRGVLSSQTSPRAIAGLRDEVAVEVDEIAGRVLARGTFDAVSELAQAIPVKIVGDLIGLPVEPRDHLIAGADAVNTTFGPATARLEQMMPTVFSYLGWIESIADRGLLRPGSWGAAILDAHDAGILDRHSTLLQLNALLVAGIDTTANALAALVRLIADRPEIWRAIRLGPEKIASAFEETLRLWPPVRGFFRLTTRDVQLGEATIPTGSRVFLHFQSANRDERHFPAPHVFDLDRNPTDHLSFGYGLHGCVGQAVARLEAHSLLASLARRVDHFELAGPPLLRDNPLINGFASLPVTAHPGELA